MATVNLISGTWTQVDYWQSQQYDSYFGEYYYCQVRLVAKESNSVSTNKSRVDFKWQKRLSAWKTGRSAYNNNSYTFKITGTGAGGDAHSATWTITLGTVNSTTWTDVGSSDYWANVQHNANGSLTVSATATGYRFDGTSFSTPESLVFPTIPRASTCTVSPSPITLSSANNTITVTTNRAVSDFTHTITVTAGSYTETKTNVGASTTFDIPYSVVGDMTASEMDCTLLCTTYNGSTQIGSQTSTIFKVKVDSSIEKAYVSSVTLTDTNTTASALETSGKFIKGISNLQAVVNFATAGTYTTLASYKITYDSVSQTSSLSGTSATVTYTKNAVVSASMTIEVTDNRGTKTTTTQTVSLIDYRAVSVSEVQIYRVNSSDQPTETGDYIHYEIKVNAFDGSFGQGGNPLALSYKYKLASASTYGSDTAITTHTGTSAGEYTTYTFSGVTGGGNLLYSNEYDIVFTLSDTFTSATSTVQRLHQGIPVFAWGEGHFDIYGALHLHDRSDVTKYISLGALNPHTETVTFSGANGGSVDWLVFDFGTLTVCVCKWKSTSNHTVSSAWSSMYTSTGFNTPDYPVTFTNVLYRDAQYLASDENASATMWATSATSVSTSNMGQIFFVRPDSGATIKHPIISQIVVGTR